MTTISITSNITAQVEEFRTIEGSPDYAVSDLGRVISKKHGKIKVLREGITQRGHRLVCLGSYKIVRYVHALVAEAFNSKRPKGLLCRHLDGDPSHNVPANLRWGTAYENAIDRFAHGTIKTKLSPDRVRALREARDSDVRALAELFGIGYYYARAVRSRKVWKHI